MSHPLARLVSNFLDRLLHRPTGQLELKVFRRGELIEHSVGKNLVVDNYKLLFSRLIGGSVSNRSVTTFGVGTSGTAPAGGNTTLTAAFTKALSSVTYPGSNQVAFNFGLASGDANGMAILEFGLLAADGTLFARKVRSAALNKDTDISFTGTWTITF